MIYQVSSGRPAGAELRRIVLEQTAFARRCLHSERLTCIEAIHRARQTVKRSRAAVYLLRPCGRRFFKEIDKGLRDLGRLLSRFRDHDVMLATIAKLHSRAEAGAGGPGLEAGIAWASDWAEANRRAIAPELTEQIAAFDSRMDELRARLRKRHTDKRRAKDMVREAHRGYAQVKRQLESAAIADHAESLHDCRKTVQRVLNQCWIMTQYDQRWVRRRVPLLRRLAKELGYHQDLHVLAQRLEDQAGDGVLIPSKDAMIELIRTEQQDARMRIAALRRQL